MKRLLMGISIFCCLLLLSGCAARSVDSQVYAVSLALDLAEDGQIRIAIQAPTLNQGGGSSEGGESSGSGKGYTLSSATGHSLMEAFDVLEATVPRKPNMTGVKNIIVSETLARSERFAQVLHDMSITYRVYGAAQLVICKGEALEFMKSQQTTVGMRLSEIITVALKHYQEAGYIPNAKAADVYFLSHSVYGDPVAIWAASGQEEVPMLAGQIGNALAGTLPRTGDNKNQYFGAALMRNGQMVDVLNGAQTQLLNLLLGDATEMTRIWQDVAVQLKMVGTPSVQVNLAGDFPDITVDMLLSATDTEKRLDIDGLGQMLIRSFEELTAYCQARSVDPFRYAESAARQFATMKEWIDYDWHSRFPHARVTYNLTLIPVEY